MPLPGVTRLCGAKCRDGHACTMPAMANGRCRKHLGKAPKGIAAGNFKTGRYSKYLPAALLEKYNESVDDPELLNMRSDIALVDARLSELLKRSGTGEARDLWQAARRANDQLQQAMNNENYGGVATQVTELNRLIGEGLADHDIWHEIADLVDQRRKLVESEQKRLVAMKQMINAQQAMTLIAALAGIVKRHVTDRHALSEIQNELTRLMTIPAQAEMQNTE